MTGQCFASLAKNYVFIGEAGCGKSEIALNLAFMLKEAGHDDVRLFDLDMTKPLFRSRDLEGKLREKGITVQYQEQFMDAPTNALGVSRYLKDRSCRTILDVGGDYMGARAIGGYARFINSEDTVVMYVVNPFRPWSADIEHIDSVLSQILGVSHIAMDRLMFVANPNVGLNTAAEDVLQGIVQLEASLGQYVPLGCICAKRELVSALPEGLKVFPIDLYLSYPWETAASQQI